MINFGVWAATDNWNGKGEGVPRVLVSAFSGMSSDDLRFTVFFFLEELQKKKMHVLRKTHKPISTLFFFRRLAGKLNLFFDGGSYGVT